MAESGLYWQNAKYAQLQELEAFRGRGGGRASWKVQNMYRQMLAFSQRDDAGAATGLGPESIEAGMESFKGLLGGSKEIQRAFKLMAKAGDSVMKFDEAIQRTTETLKYLKESGSDLSQAQKDALEKIALGDLQSAFTGAARYGGQEFLQGADAREAMQMLGLRDPTLGERVAGGAMRVGKGLMSGWGLIQMQRFWRTTGGYAMGAIGDAAGREQAAMSAAMAGAPLGDYRPGGMALSLMTLQAGRADFRANMGEAAYRAWGWSQGALGPAAATMAGIGLPAIGAGLVGGKLIGMAGGAQAGLAGGGILGATLGAFGVGSYIGSQLGDREGLALGTQKTGLAGVFGRAMANIASGTPGRQRGLPLGLAALGIVSPVFPLIAAGMVSSYPQPQQQIGLEEYGAALTSGNLAGLTPEGRAAAIQYATEQYAPDWMSQTQAMQSAAQWMAYTPGAQNIRDIYQDPLFAQMALRGMGADQFAAIGQQWNMGPATWQQIAQQQMGTSQGQAMQNEFVLGQWSGLQQWGVSGAAIRQMGYGGPGAAQAIGAQGLFDKARAWGGGLLGGLPQMSNRDRMLMSRLLGGDRMAWSQYGAGRLGMTPAVTEAFQALLPGAQPADWMITMDPETGLPLNTQRQREIQWEMMGAQNRLATFREQQQRNTFQLGYAMQTGQMYGGLGGTVSPGLVAQVSAVGGMWGLQDASTALQYRQAMAGFDYQGAMLGMQARQFGEDWQVKWGRLQTQRGWGEEEERKREERYGAQDAWWTYRWSFKKDTADIQYGRTMEDLDEAIRFATGRQKLGLMKQKERVTEDYSRQAMYMEEEKDYWEKQKQWRDEDIEDARQKRQERLKWAEEDMIRAKRHHEESNKMQQAHVGQQRAFWLERHQIEQKRTLLEREYWKEQQKAQAAEIVTSQDINKLQRDLREEQLDLQEETENHIARFRIGIDSLSESQDTLNDRIERHNRLVQQSRSPPDTRQEEDDEPPEYQGGGPVGIFPGNRPITITAHEGEYVVPQQGQLVFRDDERVISLLGRILGVLEEKATINVVVPGQGGAGNSGRIAEAAYNRYRY
jgi:hypothetical protein